MIMLERVFAQELRDAFTTHLRLNASQRQHCLEIITPLDLFMLDLGTHIMNNNLRFQGKLFDDFPEGLRLILSVDWSDIILSRKVGGRQQLQTHRNRYNHGYLKQAFLKSGEKLRASKSELNKLDNMLGGMYRDVGRGTTRRKLYMYYEQQPGVQGSQFTCGLTKLTKGLMYLCSTAFEKKPLLALVYLVNAVDYGWSPLMLKDAGDINLGFGRFEKSLELYQQLRRLPDLPESLRNRLDSLIEICELNIPASTAEKAEKTEKDAVKAAVVVEGGRAKRKKKRKSHQYSRVEASPSVAPPNRQSQITGQTLETGQSLSLPVANEPVRSDSADSESPGKSPVATLADQRAPVSPSMPPEKVTRATAGRQLFMPREGRFSDSDLMVQRFIREINAHRNNGDLVNEKLCIERWLHQGRVYGRVCEDAAWFYLRQCIFPVQMDAVILAGDNLDPKNNPKWDMLHFALDWVSRAMACYLAQPIGQRILSGRLQEMLVQLHHQNPEQKNDAETCKRLRSGCSGFGHIFSELGGLANSKVRKAFYDKGHGFFALKRVADPLYYLEAVATTKHKQQDCTTSLFN
ncbi:hypothetical protein [Endozoicomonas sp. SESOKO1]|uniref:hypothetical protein n=1 Tax=Endozoicomonas sp. SESOKO1 TaxID=2828742 RepID=UPI002147BA88|nr:hypothetical protein [Endozoicomonas sp. SESOKO1]